MALALTFNKTRKVYKMLTDYLETLKIENKSDNTIQNSRQEVTRFLKEAENKNVDLKFIVNYMKGFSSSTVNKKSVLLRGYYNYLKRVGKIKRNPFDDFRSVKREETLPDYYETKEFLKIKNAIRSLPDDSFDNALASAIFGLLYSGFRFSEILNFPLRNLDMDNRILKVKGKGGKEARVVIGQFAYDMLKKWMHYRERFNGSALLVRDISGQQISKRILRRIITDTTLKILGKKGKPHQFRHSTATHLLRECGRLDIVQDFLRHKDISTTRIYARLVEEDMRSAVGNSTILS
jgi:integrase/recombinase XerC